MATCRFSSGHVKTAARGMKEHALRQPLGDTWKFYDGHVRTAAHGMKRRAVRQPRGGIWKFFNGHAKTAARGMNRRAAVQPLEATWKFFGGHARTAVQNDTGSWKAAVRDTWEISRWQAKNFLGLSGVLMMSVQGAPILFSQMHLGLAAPRNGRCVYGEQLEDRQHLVVVTKEPDTRVPPFATQDG